MVSKGIVLQVVRHNFRVLIKDDIFVCHASKKIKLITKIMCGDQVLIDVLHKYIVRVLTRRNLILRPKVANVDKVFITTSFANPQFNTLLLAKMILFYTYHHIKPILVFTKSDLQIKAKDTMLIADYQKAGYVVTKINYQQVNLNFFKKHIYNSLTVFAGPSGVGKSSIINQLAPTLKLTTNSISKTLKRGRHTTTHSTLYPLFGGLVCDTPGFSSLQQLNVKPVDLANLFLDFAQYAPDCQFANCVHFQEKNCQVKAMVSTKISETRYNNYVSIIKEIKGE